MADQSRIRTKPRQARFVKSPQDLAGGMMLVLFAAVGWLGTHDLAFGQAGRLEGAAVPRMLAVCLSVIGWALILRSFWQEGPPLPAFPVRAGLCLAAAAVWFGLTVTPFGLVVAVPGTVLLSGLASSDMKPVELAALTVVLSAIAVGLVKFGLRLPLPLMPAGGG
jgi:hypothetical protein